MATNMIREFEDVIVAQALEVRRLVMDRDYHLGINQRIAELIGYDLAQGCNGMVAHITALTIKDPTDGNKT